MLSGVIEGFYGRPYTPRERNILIDYLSMLDKPAYVYAPKNDPFHRLRWKEDYPAEEWLKLSETIGFAISKGLDFTFGISPWQFRSGDYRFLRKKAEKAVNAGATGIAVLFDDIPDRLNSMLAVRQLQLAAEALEGFDCMIYLCPSIYCMEFFDRYDGSEYLSAWRENVPLDWQVFWTGETVIAKDLGVNSLQGAQKLLGAKPLIWDNLLADDYSMRRIYLAGLDDRIPEGYSYFLNPSSCFPVALHAVYMLLKATGISCGWPSELGSMPGAWNILGGFHHIPWNANEETELLLSDMVEAAFEGPSRKLMEKLGTMTGVLSRFAESIEEIEDGFELMPYIVDLRKMLTWWKEALSLPSRSERIERLKYLMFERLPFDHPLSIVTSLLSTDNREG